MEIKTKIIILVITWFILFGGNYSRPDVRPEVNVGDYISDFESMGYAGLFHMMGTVSADEIKPDNVAKCTCNGTGKVSYDGGTSWTDCPCKVAGGNCLCKSDTKTGSNIELDNPTIISDADYISYLLRSYSVAKATSENCGPCKRWNTDHLDEFKKLSIKVNEYYAENPNNAIFFESAGVDQYPIFYVCSKVDNVFHKNSDGRTLSFAGSSFTSDDAIELMGEVDNLLHPNLKSGTFYIRQQSAQTKLNGTYYATKEQYIAHLSTHENHKSVANWPLKDLSVYELKAIHDDNHAGKLGKINEF